VEAALRDEQQVRVDAIDQTVLAVDTPGPIAFPLPAQGFWLTNAGEWMLARVGDELIDLFCDRFFCPLPPVEIFGGFRGQKTSSCRFFSSGNLRLDFGMCRA
jgi:hypothetical protein